jgi:beta-galactosidase
VEFSVGLPHSASIPFFIDDSAYVGWTWYRKHLTIDGAYSGKQVFVEFEAAFQHAWVYVNGTLVGEHKGGYTGFTYNVTPQVIFGQDNVIAVRLSNLWDAAIAPRAGDAWFHNGIYRDVSLVITNPLHVVRLGTFVTTPGASAARSPVNIKTDVINQGQASKTCLVKSTILDSIKQMVASVSTTVTIAAGQETVVSQDTVIVSPKLWSPASPYRYSVYTQIYDNGTEVDDYTTMFGVRWYSATAANGFSLNGSHLVSARLSMCTRTGPDGPTRRSITTFTATSRCSKTLASTASAARTTRMTWLFTRPATNSAFSRSPSSTSGDGAGLPAAVS